jgi:tripartite-type tricarboxylate transporter receptor subunit TctC
MTRPTRAIEPARRAALALCCIAALVFATAAAQQPYPNRPIKLIVPYTPGTGIDILARVLGDKLAQKFNVGVVVDNRPGASGNIGTEAVSKSAPDGYTLLMMSNTHTVNESLIAKKPYKLMTDLVPVTPVNYSDLLLVVNPNVPAKNLKELIALVKSKPGALNYASSGPGTPYHMAGELFKAMAGLDIVHVPHKESSGARTSVISGDVQMMFDAITVMAKLAEAGKVRAIASSGLTRSAVMPDIPTISEAGVPGYEAVIWLGLMAPAGTPKPIIDRLNAEVQKVLKQPDVKEAWSKQGAVPMFMTPSEFGQYLQKDIEKWAKVVQISGAKVD